MGAPEPGVTTPEFTHITQVAQRHPDRVALVCEPGGRQVTFGALERLANQVAHALRRRGLRPGDCIALCLSNRPTFVATVLGALRSGLYYTLIPPKASAGDVQFICADSGALLLLIEPGPALDELQAPPGCVVCVSREDWPAGDAWQAELAAQPDTLPDDPAPGMEMMYSSGSTGRPKGVRKPPICQRWDAPDPRNLDIARSMGVHGGSVYLSTSPLYHSAPHRYLLAFVHAGAMSVLMERFDAQGALAAIDRHGCTHSLWVPTMFHRMLRLAPEVRAAYAGRTMTHAIHGAAPCPPDVKRAMIDWWGPILIEYYSGTEGVGRTIITSAEWLAHPGSVGKPRGCSVHILDAALQELPVGEIGTVYFESPVTFDYWGDPAKTRQAISPQGWKTFGDIGRLDADGYLYLTDRQGFMVISGGVNLYPQEIEHTLMAHPEVVDAAVFGVPDDDLGERLVAVVQLAAGAAQDAVQERALQDWCRRAGGAIKVPKQIRFVDEFPRMDSGKVQKKRLREWFLGASVG